MQVRRAVRVVLRVALLVLCSTAPTAVSVIAAATADIVHVRVVILFHRGLVAVREAELGPHLHFRFWCRLLVLLVPGACCCGRRGERRRLRGGELGKGRRGYRG